MNKSGIYGLRFCINGVFKTIYIDDYIPVDRETKEPVFSRTKDSSPWLSLLEKAWAKIHGNYERTCNGNIGDAYLILTGAPVKIINFDTEEKLFASGQAIAQATGGSGR